MKDMKWCHKILPLVYDDSMSYYEVLCKFRENLKELYDILDGKLGDQILTIIARLILNVTYDEETECITFNLDSDSGDRHVYDPLTNTLRIEKGVD